MARSELTKRVAIDKANVQMVIAVGLCSFITVFCLVASKTLISQNSYQARVVSAEETAHQTLQQNITTYNNLKSSYENFVSAPTNVLGQASGGTGAGNNNNAKVILDALPPSYDFPALTSSIAKILSVGNFQVTSIGGTDNQLTEESNNSSPSPAPVSMPFTFAIDNGNYAGIGQLFSVLEASIRPIQIDTLELSGAQNNMTLTVTAHTYYQPQKSLNITTQVVK